MEQDSLTLSNQYDLKVFYNMVVERFYVGNYQEAERMMQIIYDTHTNLPSQYLKTYAAILQSLTKYEQALSIYQQAQEIEYPQQNECLFYAGVCLFKMKFDQQARDYLQQFIQEGNNNSKIISRAKLYLKLIQKRRNVSTSPN
jgi:tetratricopeptide (TPR) repeat protein